VDLLHRVCNEDDIDQQKHLYLVGATRVYLSQALLEQLEWRLEQKYTVSARLIQNWWRNRFSRQMVPTSYQEINETAVIMRGLGLNGPKWDPMDKLSTELASWIFDDILQSNHVMYGQRHVYRIRDLMDKLQDGQVILTAMEAIFDELPAVDRQDIDAVFNLISAILRCAIGSDEESAVDDDSQHSSTFLSAKDFNDNPAKVLSILQRFRQYVIEKQRETDDGAVVKREVHLHEQGSTKSSFTSPWSLAISQRRFICKASF
jgi:hypothetical protein